MDPSDPRLFQRLKRWQGEAADAVIVGVPCDDGVVLGGGRAGAAEGPSALRQALRRFGVTYDLEHDVDFDSLRLGDAGDVEVVSGEIAHTHDEVTARVGEVLDAGAVAIVVGGGNDATFGSVRALSQRAAAAGGVNVDAHFDVRPVVDGKLTSGTPYFRIVEELGIAGERLGELAAHSSVNARAHARWLAERGVACVPLPVLRKLGARQALEAELARIGRASDALFVSIDLDVFAGAFAPGVSAPGTEGLTPEEGRAIAHAAGQNPKLRLFEIMELCPRHDVDLRTARLGVLLLCAFLSGLARRKIGA
jgi:formimidoylglutamase